MAKTAKSNARQRAEQARLARERAQRRERRLRTAWWAIAAGPAFVVLLLLINVAIRAGSGGGGTATTDLTEATAAALNPSASTLDTAGRGQGVSFPNRTQDQPPLTEGDKPLVLYVGAEYCPFCGSQRWPLVIALNRFGSFQDLSESTTPSPGIPTVSFHGSTYTSQYLVFQGVELTDNEHEPLDTLTTRQEQLMALYNAPPYTERSGSVPFLDFGNQFLQTGSSIDTQQLAGLTHEQVAAELTTNPTGPIAQSILGAANAFTAILCGLTGGAPAEVCTSPAAAAFQQEVG
jgi:hypothetical protein